MSDNTEARLVALETRMANLEAQLARQRTQAASGGQSNGLPHVDLDGSYGNPVIKYEPKKWIKDGGASYAGCKLSDCPSDYLFAYYRDKLSYAQYLDQEGKVDDKGRPKSKFAWQEAAAAKGWAERNKDL